MFGFFKKKKVEKEPRILRKRTKQLLWKKEKVNIGKIEVKLTFLTGETLFTIIYGNFSQYTNDGSDDYFAEDGTQMAFYSEPCVGQVKIISARRNAEEFVKNLSERNANYSDDKQNPTKVLINMSVKTAEIQDREMDHLKEIYVAYVADVEKKDE